MTGVQTCALPIWALFPLSLVCSCWSLYQRRRRLYHETGEVRGRITPVEDGSTAVGVGETCSGVVLAQRPPSTTGQRAGSSPDPATPSIPPPDLATPSLTAIGSDHRLRSLFGFSYLNVCDRGHVILFFGLKIMGSTS